MRSWFTTQLSEIEASSFESLFGRLTTAATERRLPATPESLSAWKATAEILETTARELFADMPFSGKWHVCLEFELPRRRRRIDVVVLADDLIFLIEIKAGAARFDRANKWQAEQYALDLRDFHYGSEGRQIIPILVATDAPASESPSQANRPQDFVFEVQSVRPSDLAERIRWVYDLLHDPSSSVLEGANWDESPYKPSPSIIEAARDLYEKHDVRAISLAGSENLDSTVDCIVQLVERCQKERRRGIAFITGAPGSGKTLAGLQVVHDRRLAAMDAEGVFLSGNMPLVEVITGALTASSRESSARGLRDSARRVSTFIQHAFAFRNEYAEYAGRIPSEHIVLFDEAQRAWDRPQVTRWTRGASSRSEPQILLDVMSRVPEWSVVIAMVGSGQEINRGEAGLGEWGRALREFHSDWIVSASPAVLPDSPAPPGGRLFDSWPEQPMSLENDPRLHLVMNVRSPRAELLNTWVDALLSLDMEKARSFLPSGREYPLVLTRSLEQAKAWLRDRTDQDHRCGLVANADARRLRAWGLDTNVLRQDRGWSNWFLKPHDDVRSSFQLEVPASNFDCQGLELDWVGVCWGNDLTLSLSPTPKWRMRQFRGSRWVNANEERANYMLNSYRVLLTRARFGQVIWVPRPDRTDRTLEIDYFDGVANLLEATGVPVLEDGAQ